MKKLISILVAMAMMLSLTVIAAFAAPNAGGTEAAPAQGVITKELKMPIGTTTPAETFTFTFTSQDNAPAIADKTVTYAQTDAGTTAGDVKTVYKTTANFADASLYSHAGRYVYTVKETVGSTDGMTYSQAQYTVTIDVANGEEDLYIKNIAVQQTKEDDGTDSPAADKVDPSVPGQGDTDGNGFKFGNTYVKTQVEDDDEPEDPEDPDSPDVDTDDTNDGIGLYVKKVLGGDLGDKTKDFDFSVTVTKPTLSTTTTYNAEIVDDKGVVQSTEQFTSGTAKTIQLKDGWKLIFNDLEVGAAFAVNEVAASATGYTAVVSGTGDVEEGVNTGAGLVTENQDNVTVTNTLTEEGTTPTGILISNLPYIALALVAIGGLVAYVVVRRKADDEA